MKRIRDLACSTGGAFVIYAAASLAFFGRPLRYGDVEYIGKSYDPQLFIWSLEWWPHAILNGENPFVTHAMWPVTGVNLAWVTAVPLLAILAAPLTLTLGPVISYNLLAVALPALAATSAFVLCRYLTGSWWASLAGGYLFGFSAYVLGHTMGHPGQTAVFLVPLVALTVLQFLDGRIGRGRLALQLGVLLGLQPYLSTELLATLVVCLVASLLVAYLLVPAVRPGLRDGALALLAALGVAVVVAAPMLAYALTGFHTSSINDPARFPADLLNVVVPTETALVSTEGARELSREFVANLAENGAYLGLPLLVVLGWFAWQSRHQPGRRLVVALLGLGIVAELGVALHVAGERIVPLPWALAAKLPALNNVLPVRFSMYVALASAVAASLWAASPRPARWVRVTLAGAAVVSILPAVPLAPTVQRELWRHTPTRPAFFADETYRACFRPDEVVFVPDGAGMDVTLWQAESSFRFRVANGNLSSALPQGIPYPEDAFSVMYDAVPAGGGPAVVRLARALESTVILLDEAHIARWSPPLEAAGLHPVDIGGVRLYPLRPLPATCRA